MPLTRSVVQGALTGALISTLVVTAVPSNAISSSKAAAQSASPTTKAPLGWNSSTKAVRVVATPVVRQQAQVHRAHATRATAVRLRSTTSKATTRAQTWTAWVRPTRTHQARLRAVRPHANGTQVLAGRTVTVHAGRWNKIQVTSTLPSAGQPTRANLRITGLARGERVKVAAVRAERRPSTSFPPAQKPSKPVTPTPEKPAPEKPSTGNPVAGTLTNGCAYDTRGLPSCGSYLGMAYGSNTDPTAVESELGGRLGVRRTYYRADQVTSAVTTARKDLAAGRLPWISFKFPHDWKAMASGTGDAWARDIATKLAALPGPVWVAFHHEPENDGDIQQWRAAQERLAPIVRAKAPNVAYTVVLTGWHQFFGPSEFSLANIWPRTKVDVAGFDIYNSHGVVKNGKTLKATDMDAAYFAKIQAWARTEKVAWGLAETGYTNTASVEDPDWIQRTQTELTARGGVAMAYFNTTLNSIAPWDLTSAAKKAAYRKAQAGTPRLPLS